ncbi:Os02g0261800 [Oryza sativa Japonica Group]|uniref:Os02g0261800 protein n=1 Tax=Oryza sativa subsp. japonica TaxID=39947 RepID=Q0E284_ORYSJ|nr:Os02g0261800 [Oryza sativa Japonica Group]|eukprot:NP_001046490.2 Os02g0261800 [Oryza sativa Japonica Group]
MHAQRAGYLPSCPNFSSLLRPSSECSVSHIQDINTTWFPNLCDLDIRSCPKLSLPPMPHTSTLTRVSVRKGDETLLYFREEELTAYHYDGALALHNLGKVKAMEIVDMLHFPLADLQNLNCLTRHSFEDCDNIDNTVVLHSVQSLYLDDCHLTGKSLTMVLSIFPALTYFNLRMFGENHDIEEIVLQAPITCSLCHMSISSSKNLVLPVEDGGGLQELSSLQSLRISDCGRMFSRWCMVDAGARTSKPLPSSLRELSICRESSMQSMALLSNLTSLTHLTLLECEDLTVDGFDPLITLNLKELVVLNNCYENNYSCSIAADLLSEMTRTKVLSAGSLQLEALKVDNISGVLVPSICSLLAANLHKLIFKSDLQMESFDEEQEHALQLLTSLKQLYFADCPSLLSLPDGLHHISSLQKLHIYNCPKIGFLPKEGFPSSLRDLVLSECSVDLQDQLKKLETSNPDLFQADSYAVNLRRALPWSDLYNISYT